MLYCRNIFKSIGFILSLTIAVSLLVACEGAVNDDISVSGSISIAPGTSIDSDINDVNAQYQSNNSIELAQAIPNPTTLGGYVNIAFNGPQGRSYESGDVDDYFVVQLFAGQNVTLAVAEQGVTVDGTNTIAMFLKNAEGTILQHTFGQSQVESVSVNTDGIYYIDVKALDGAANYLLTIGLASTQGASSNTSSQTDELSLNDDFVPGEIIVEFNQSSVISAQSIDLHTAASNLGLQAKAGAPTRSMLMEVGGGSARIRAFNTLGIKSSGTVTTQQINDPLLQQKQDTIAVVRALRQRSDIRSARLNYYRKVLAVPNDEYYNLQWHYPLINLPQAWDITTGQNSVIVGVIDTGVLLSHPDLQGQLVAGYDFISNATNARDGNGIDSNPNDVGDNPNGGSSFHGTHVSGTIAASTNNSVGIAGIAWNVKIMPLRVLGQFGGTDYDIEQAIRFAAQLENDSGTIPPQKADIINLSLGGPTNSTNPPPAYQLARNNGVIIVAAAGNDASSGLSFPASLNGVVSVSAVDINKNLASYSNFGTTIDVAAPGGGFGDVNADGFPDGVLSAIGRDRNGSVDFRYAFYQGTSMAAPHIAGVAALMRSVYPQLSPNEFDQLLSNGQLTQDLGTSGRDNQFGYGLIDALKAVRAAAGLNNTPVDPVAPYTETSPTALNFGFQNTSQSFTISNGGDGDLSITGITDNSGGWLTVVADANNANGLGSYTAFVDRDQLPEQTQTYTATIHITSTVDEIDLPVIMQVLQSDFVDNAGFQYVLLLDSQTTEIKYKVPASLQGARYSFNFDNVAPGSYKLKASTDSDNDGQYCESGEACGSYPILSNTVDIVVDEATGNKSVLNFETGFENLLGAGGNATIMIQEPLLP